MQPNTHRTLHLARVVEGIWTLSASNLGENHLLTQALETALRSDDPDLMLRALRLVAGSPDGIKQRILVQHVSRRP